MTLGEQNNTYRGRHAAPAHAAAASKGSQARSFDMEPKAKKKRGPWFVVFIVALIVFIGSLVALGLIGFSYLQGQQKYDRVAEMAHFEAVETAIAQQEEVPLKELTVDWDALIAANSDTVGWIYIPGTQVNYPIVKGPDNDFYLTADFDRTAGWLANFGAIFMDYRNTGDFTDEATFVYGHHMQDGSMFADVANMRNQEMFDKCRTAYLLTPGGNYRLRTFSLVYCDANDTLVQQSFASADVRTAYVQDKIDRSVVSVPDCPQASEIDRMVALATCDDSGNARYVLYCYIEETTAEGLSGTVGIATEGGEATGLVDQLDTESQQAADTQPAEGGQSAASEQAATQQAETEQAAGEQQAEGEQGQ